MLAHQLRRRLKAVDSQPTLYVADLHAHFVDVLWIARQQVHGKSQPHFDDFFVREHVERVRRRDVAALQRAAKVKRDCGVVGLRHNGVMIANEQGMCLQYSLFNLQDRGRLLVEHGDEVYEGQIVGIHSRDNDLVVNPLKGKKLTNVRAAGSDEKLIMTPPIRLTLEQALEFINDDELVEITPKFIRVRKKFLKEHERKKADRAD